MTRQGSSYVCLRWSRPRHGRVDELAKVMADKATFEPRLRSRADLEIDTRVPLAEVVERVLALVGAS